MVLGEIVYDSIIENKEKTKSYWEQLMLAANSPSQSESVVMKPSKPISSTSPSSLTIQQEVVAENHNSETANIPKSIETVTKEDTYNKNSFTMFNSGKQGSVIEREIQLQKEKEAAFVEEREASFKLSKATSKLSIDQEEMSNLSMSTTDDGNFSEYGSEDKEEHSLDESRSLVMSPENNIMRSGLHLRTQSLDSMSSGHSSGSIGSLSSGLPIGETVPFVRRRPITVKPLDEPEEDNLFEFSRSENETPIEKEIRLFKEREDELRNDKQRPKVSDSSRGKSNSLTPRINKLETAVKTAKLPPTTAAVKIVPSATPKGCLKKVNYKSKISDSTPIKNSDSVGESMGDQNGQRSSAKLNVNSVDSPNSTGAVPKLFTKIQTPKGFMNRFIASRGKLTFSSSPTVFSEPNNRLRKSLPATTTTSTPINSKKRFQSEKSRVGSRPGYVSAEDKIQHELREMRKREQELKEQRAKSFVRSHPNLLHLLKEEDEEEDNQKYVQEPRKLRSAMSNPNLVDMDDNAKVSKKKAPIKRTPMIDVWENLIQKVEV